MSPAMSRDEILAEIIERPREAYIPLPDTRLIVRPGWRQVLTPSVKRGGFNEVSFSRLGDGADEVIDATIAQYRAVGCRFVWRLGPDSSDIGAKLAARGLVHVRACGMARSTEMTSAGDVEEVDESTVELFTRTLAEGWNMDPSVILPANVAAVQRRGSARPRQHLFLARVDGEAAAAASSVVFDRSVYLMGGVTIERFRNRGLYRALVAARLAHARASGIALATSHAREETSAPILERLGFETFCHYDNYSFIP